MQKISHGKNEERASPHFSFGISLPFLFFLFLNVLAHSSYSQSLTGIWRGSFGVRSGTTSSVGNADRYNFEVQLLEKSNGELMGVTYSYKKKEFFGKARFSGSVSADRKRVIIKELAITDVTKNAKADVCAMICNLFFSKNSNGTEKLSGSFTSNNLSTKTKCYDGDVILLRVSQSTFPVESFLQNKINNQPKRDVKAAQSDDTVVIDRSNRKKYLLEVPDNNDRKQPRTIAIEKVTPAELGGRENHLTASITQPNKEVSVMIYDNGIIDNDTIGIYIDSEKRYSGVRLTEKPLTFVLSFSELKTSYELITVAENLGEIAPNTGLLVIQSGNKMIEIPIMSNFKRNAKIIISYRANCKVAVERYD
jgi:hypothetical protein